MRRKNQKKNEVNIIGFDEDGNIIDDITITYDEYYESSLEIIDSNEYRSRSGVVLIKGAVYDHSGQLDQEFENRYNQNGEYIGGRVVHSDGTIIED
jgi:hypothetical protein